MIKGISFECYRKLKNISIEFSKNINIISGTNGTCKSSILHIISNSFQTVKNEKGNSEFNKCISIIRSINDKYNPKIESLTRGDKQFQDPAPGHKGAYYTVEYYGEYSQLSFRKHNSKNPSTGYRYAVKPQYKSKSGETLPTIPVIYLGLNRLATYGEFTDEETIVDIKKSLPPEYLESIIKTYHAFTNYTISKISNQHMGTVKIRADFDCNETGIDSNTISAGEDNLYIILSALECLRYYYDTLSLHNEVDSILLIDEFDATLHPAFQFRLLDHTLHYSKEYGIQVVFTSHSLSLIEYCLKQKQNLIYLYDNITSIILMEQPSIYKINLYLKSQTQTEYSFEKRIPVFSEDDEARYLLSILFDYYSETHEDFAKVRHYFYLVDANIGSETLSNIFSDPKLNSFTGNICILDGDHNGNPTNKIIALPGKDSPENFLIQYAKVLYERDDEIWISEAVLEENIGKDYYLHSFIPDVENIEQTINNLKSSNQSTKGVLREKNKNLFLKHKKFFHILFDRWITDPLNKSQMDKFYKDLFSMYQKVAPLNGIDPSLWKNID